MLLSGKVAIITGASRGIGKGIAKEFVKGGATVVIADTDKDESFKTSNQLTQSGGKVSSMPTDIRSDQETDMLLKTTLHQFGKIDILVNNAGLVHFGPEKPLKSTEKEFLSVFDVNYHASRKISRKVGNYMKENKIIGSIIFITSIHAHLIRMQEHYHASKAALEATMQELAAEFGPYGIRSNAIAPGGINTAEEITEEGLKSGPLPKEIFLKRMGTPKDVAMAALFLASDEFSAYITGTTINVDGGLSQSNWATRLYLESTS